MGLLNGFLRRAGLADARLENASGVGSGNRMAAAQIVALLRLAASSPRYRPVLDALARPGMPGTLERRLLDSSAEGRLRAKTGTGGETAALSGVVDAPTGRPLAFSAILGGVSDLERARVILDALAILLSSLG